MKYSNFIVYKDHSGRSSLCDQCFLIMFALIFTVYINTCMNFEGVLTQIINNMETFIFRWSWTEIICFRQYLETEKEFEK